MGGMHGLAFLLSHDRPGQCSNNDFFDLNFKVLLGVHAAAYDAVRCKLFFLFTAFSPFILCCVVIHQASLSSGTDQSSAKSYCGYTSQLANKTQSCNSVGQLWVILFHFVKVQSA